METEKIIRLSVRNLVEFILKEGDIDNRISGTLDKDAMLMGGRLHRKIQRMMGSNYQAEVSLKLQLPCDGFQLKLEGRADGILLESEKTIIDEIKGVVRSLDRVERPVPVHLAQAKCYAYIYARQQGLKQISVQMTYCNLDTEDVKRFREEYTFEELEVDLGENLFVPGSVLKKLRKEAFAQMDQTKILKYRRTYEDPVKENDVASSQEQEDSKIQIAVSMENLEYLDIVTEDREVMKIYLSWMELKQQEDPQSILNKIKTAGKQCYLMLPQIARKRQMEELKAKKDLIFTNEIDGLLVRNLEEFSWLIEEGYQKEMIADYMFYGYNKEAVKEYQRLSGIQIRMTYPSELNKKEMEQLELLNADLFLYGYQPLMVSAQCVKNNLRGCDKTPSWLTLKDRYNANFFVHTSCCDCINEIYNGKPLWVGNEAGILNDLHPSVIRFHITRENEVQVKEILNAAKSIQKGERASLATEYTTGHLKREVL